MSSPEMRGIAVDLDYRRFVRIELAPSEIRTEQQQYVAVQNGMIAGGTADHAGHADIVRIIVFDEILAARCVRRRRLKACRGGDLLVMGTFATSASVDGDRLTLVENGRNRV